MGDAAESAPASGAAADVITVLEAQIDDSNGQVVAHACERLLSAGALDAYVTPIIMKKGRPGQLVTVLCEAQRVREMEEILFSETSTFGARRYESLRTKLPRESAGVQTRFGLIQLKLGWRGDQSVQAWPEYESCAAAARRTGAPLRVIQEEALRTWQRTNEH